jgi:hypothetical protein
MQYLNQIFYNNNDNANDEKIIQSLQKFSYYDNSSLQNEIAIIKKREFSENMNPKYETKTNPETHIIALLPDKPVSIQNNVLPITSIVPTVRPIAKRPINNNNRPFIPPLQNTLFWTIFISVYGYDEYIMVKQKYSNREIGEKQIIINHLKKNPKILKNSNYKVTNDLCQEILSELIINNNSSLLSCIGFSIFYKRPIYIINETNNTYLLFSPDKDTNIDEEDEPIIIYNSKPLPNKNHNATNSLNACNNSKRVITDKYGIYLSENSKPIGEIIQNMFYIENYNKPLKGISTYKMTELEIIAKKLNINHYDIETNKLLKKQVLYEKINSHCNSRT